MTAVATPSWVAGGEQSRARYPDATGIIERDGVRVFWERYGEGKGDGRPAILFAPTYCLKAQ